MHYLPNLYTVSLPRHIYARHECTTYTKIHSFPISCVLYDRNPNYKGSCISSSMYSVCVASIRNIHYFIIPFSTIMLVCTFPSINLSLVTRYRALIMIIVRGPRHGRR